MKIKFQNPLAFRAFAEPATWRQDKPPHRRGVFPVAVLQSESQSQAAGPTLDGIPADPWTLVVALDVALVADFKRGDTIILDSRATGRGPAPSLVIQQITRTRWNWVVRCTDNERAPLN